MCSFRYIIKANTPAASSALVLCAGSRRPSIASPLPLIALLPLSLLFSLLVFEDDQGIHLSRCIGEALPPPASLSILPPERS